MKSLSSFQQSIIPDSTWNQVKEFAHLYLDQIRQELERIDLSETKSAAIRGEIKALKTLLAMEKTLQD